MFYSHPQSEQKAAEHRSNVQDSFVERRDFVRSERLGYQVYTLKISAILGQNEALAKDPGFACRSLVVRHV